MASAGAVAPSDEVSEAGHSHGHVNEHSHGHSHSEGDQQCCQDGHAHEAPVVIAAEPYVAEAMPSSAEVFLLARQQNFGEMLKLLELCPQHWTAQDDDGHSLLHWSSLVGNTEIAKLVVEKGCPVDIRASNKQTPLMWASLRGHVPVARYLLSVKADLRAQDSLGATPLIIAIQHKSYSSMLLLINRGKQSILTDSDRNGCTSAHWAAYKGDIMALKLLDYFEADLLSLDGQRMYPIHRAVRASQHQLLEFLIERKSDPMHRNADGKTCLDLAEDQNDAFTLTVLKKLMKTHGLKIEGKEGVQGDLEQGAVVKEDDSSKKEGIIKSIMKDQLAQKAFPVFWLICVSLATFQYLIELRSTSYEVAPIGSMLFEIGVPLSLIAFAMAALSDPGIIPAKGKGHSGVEDLMKAIDSDQAQAQMPDLSRLCTTTWVLKDLRTKFCAETGNCVSEFDHYCVWLNGAVGKGNHRCFVFLCFVEFFTQLCHIYLCWNMACTLVVAPSFLSWIGRWIGGFPLLFLIMLIQMLTAPWVAMLCFHQSRLILMNLTTNEMMNMQRYEHFWISTLVGPNHYQKQFVNPFHKGSAWKNCLDFWVTKNRSKMVAVADRHHACAHGCKH